MADEIRITIGVSTAAKNRLVNAAKELGVTQWEMAEIAFNMIDANNPTAKIMANRIKQRNDAVKSKKKDLMKKLSNLTSEQIAELLR